MIIFGFVDSVLQITGGLTAFSINTQLHAVNLQPFHLLGQFCLNRDLNCGLLKGTSGEPLVPEIERRTGALEAITLLRQFYFEKPQLLDG
jgi:hypothetical protein